MEVFVKKILFLAAVLFACGMSVFAQEIEQEQEQEQVQVQTTRTQAQERKSEDRPIDLHMNFTSFGGGIYMPLGGEFIIELLKFGFEHKASGVGASFHPFNFYGWVGGGGGDIGISIINMTVYWNILSLLVEGNDKFYIAPYMDFHYLFMKTTIDPSRYIFSAGMQGGIRGGNKVKYNVFSIETGFRLVDSDPVFFANIKFDFIMFLLSKNGVMP